MVDDWMEGSWRVAAGGREEGASSGVIWALAQLYRAVRGTLVITGRELRGWGLGTGGGRS